MKAYRDISTLLQIVIDSLKLGHKENYYNYGICGEVENLKNKGIIDYYEESILLKFIHNNRPNGNNKFKKYTQSIGWVKYSTTWWWKMMSDMEETRQIRIDFLTDLKNSL